MIITKITIKIITKMVEEKDNKWSYIFKNSSRDLILMAMITVSMVGIIVTLNISNEQNSYLIKMQEQDKIKDDKDANTAKESRDHIFRLISNLNNDIADVNLTASQAKTLLIRLLLFEEQLHNENIEKINKLNKIDKMIIDAINNNTEYQKELSNKIDEILIIHESLQNQIK